MSTELIIFIVAIVVIDLLLLWAALKVIPERERGIIYAQGKPLRIAGPGLVLVVPFIQKLERFNIPLDVTRWHDTEGDVIIGYKTWPAASSEPLHAGDKVIPVTLTDGWLIVQKKLEH